MPGIGITTPKVAALFALSGLLVAQTKLHYPDAKKIDHTDDYTGIKIADPYRWLENADSADTETWVIAENKIASEYLATLPGRTQIKTRLTKLFDQERFNGAFQKGGRYFFFRNNGLQNQSVLYVLDNVNGQARILLDPNTLRADGTAALSGMSVSPDGKLLAYAIAQAGSDWSEWRVRYVLTGKDHVDLIQWTKHTTPSWMPNSAAFYYSRYPEPLAGTLLTAQNYNQQLYVHQLGDMQAKDKLVYERPDHKQWAFSGEVSADGRYLGITVFDEDFAKNRFFYRDLKSPTTPVVELIPDKQDAYEWIGNVAGEFYFRTTSGAPRGRIVAIDVAHPESSRWKEIIAQQKEPIDAVRFVDGKFILSYFKDAHGQTKLYSRDGRYIQEISLPDIGTVTWSSAEPGDHEIFYSFSSFTSPTTLYRYDLTTQKSTLFRASKVNFDPAQFETKQVFYASKDGTRVPMFLVYKKGIRLDGSNPTLLYGYGGFNIALTPSFNASTLVWMEMGGIYAVANLRGGSEYGEEWHQAGTKLQKQNVFDDFIAAAEWLISNKYTSTPKLAISGGSNGGLLVGAVLNQRPDLFGAALPAVGVMDMLRFNKFTGGAAWMGDYGSPEIPEEFKALRAYSPLHNIRSGAQYPPTLITTSDHDDRVVPGHSFKYAAALQAAQEGPAPILIRIETRAGHGAGKPTTKIIDEAADRWAFLAKSLNIDIRQTALVQ